MPDLQYYRNKLEVRRVEPGSLWYKRNGLFILVDDDEFVGVPEATYKEYFYQVDKPPELS